MPVATFRCTELYFLECQRRLRREVMNWRALWIVLLITLMGLVILNAWSLWSDEPLGLPFVILLIVTAVYAVFLLGFWWLLAYHPLRVFRNSPAYDQMVRIDLREDGFHATNNIGTVSLTWAAFVKVVHFRDGFLVFQTPQIANWIPARSLGSADAITEVERILRQNIQEHKVIQYTRWEDPQKTWD